jgi:6,7-dimethyl-8-ribityllumazine synthase
MFGADKGNVASNDSRLNGKKLSIGIVQARFNAPITDALAKACKAELVALGVSEKDIDHVTVPGALEALGCIVRGETYHFELVANESGAGVTRISLDYQLPIANAILTTEDMPQAVARQEEKGRDAARVAVEMANLLESI